MATYSIVKRENGKIQATAETLDEARSMGAFISKSDLGSIAVFRGTNVIGFIRHDNALDLYTWNGGINEPTKLLDPFSGKVRAFPKGMYLVKYMRNGPKEAVIYARGMDDLRKKIIETYKEASAENSRYLGNVMYRQGRYIWRVPVDLKKYVFKDTDIDPRTGKLVGTPRKHAPYER